METIKIAGFGGSLRKESYSRYLLENAVGLMLGDIKNVMGSYNTDYSIRETGILDV